VDGLKTGYYREAKRNVTATANRDNLRLIAVIMGAEGATASVRPRGCSRGVREYKERRR
jgi:D-alanyl-D-alanine carboxypeptidase